MGALDGKVTLIAGGGTGIGRATAELFAAEGARVVVFGRRAAPLTETVEAIVRGGGKAQAVAGDAAVEADAARLVETAQADLGGVDTLVNCAAVRLRAPLTEISGADFAEVLRINLVGAFVLTKAVVAAMRARGGGSIIHIGSALGTVAAPDFSPYVASKGGVHQLARAAAVELVQDEIRVNVVAPGTIDTAIGMGVPEFRRHLLKHRIPIGRAGHVSDVAAACLYLASDASRYVTGSILAVDGGWTAS
jgi:meso-butanediol dehydrogenase / (S,S)-butanediol dehydrogenase / diacetyl reductase